jgi:phage/plasmid-like protein (TIGR03299 family)
MSHDITATDNIAFIGGTPWHQLGFNLSEHKDEDPETIFKLFRDRVLNWQAVDMPLTITTASGIQVPTGRKAIVRSDMLAKLESGDIDARQFNDSILTYGALGWTAPEVEHAIDWLRDWQASGLVKLEVAGTLRGGKMVWALARIMDEKGRAEWALEGGPKGRWSEQHAAFLLLTLSFEHGACSRADNTSVRAVCKNTIAAAHREQGCMYKQDHRRAFDFEAASKAVENGIEAFAAYKDEAEALAALAMTEVEAMTVLSRQFQPFEKTEEVAFELDHAELLIADQSRQNKALRQVWNSYNNAPGAVPGTAYGVLQGATHWKDHIAGSAGEGWTASSTVEDIDVRTDKVESRAWRSVKGPSSRKIEAIRAQLNEALSADKRSIIQPLAA